MTEYYGRLSHQETQDRAEARADEYRNGVITETVYRASLFALGYRGDDIRMEVHKNWPGKRV